MKPLKKIVSLLLTLLLLLSALPAMAARDITPQDYDPVGDDISTTVSPYLEAGGTGSTQNFLTIDDFASHVITFINIWSDGCGPCVNEMPYFQQIHEEYADQGVLVVGGCTTWIGGSYSAEYTYLQSNGYTYINVIPDTVLRTLYQHNSFVPQTFIVNSQGVVIDFIGGSTTYNNLVQKIQYWLSFYGGEPTTHTVTFVDGVTNGVIETQSVQHGYAPVYPEAPVHEGYTFNAWSPASVAMVTEDMTITATYTAIVYRVRFYDSITGDRLKTQFVNYGQSATPPDAPEHDGYIFIGWDQDYTFITGAVDIYTVYEEGEPQPQNPVGDANFDGTLSFVDVASLYHMILNGSALTPEQLYVCDVNGDGSVSFADVSALYNYVLAGK